MGENTAIEWADDTFNPWIGCTKVGPGCDNCYAEAQDKHRQWTPDGWGKGKPRHRTAKSTWRNPLKWNREAEAAGVRRRVFCASLADVFDNGAPNVWRSMLFDLIRATPWLDWILLTKRIGNVEKMLPADWGEGYPNVWLMITVIDQLEADRDIPKLINTPARVRGLSIEPQLGPVDIEDYKQDLDWVLSGGESGAYRRPYHEDWTRILRDQCVLAGIAFLYKQRIDNGKKIKTPELDGRRWIQFPGDVT